MFKLFRSSTRRLYSTVVRSPPSSAPRVAPTPLVFVSATGWDASSGNGVTYLCSMLAEKGYTCLQTDLRLPDGHMTRSEKLLGAFEAQLRDEIRLSTMPFPPIVFARSLSCLIAQAYISSNPASGLFLISPPVSNVSVPETLLPTRLPEFNFEPKFPIAIMATDKEIELLREHHRLGRDPGVDTMAVRDLEGTSALSAIEEWLDLVGI